VGRPRALRGGRTPHATKARCRRDDSSSGVESTRCASGVTQACTQISRWFCLFHHSQSGGSRHASAIIGGCDGARCLAGRGADVGQVRHAFVFRLRCGVSIGTHVHAVHQLLPPTFRRVPGPSHRGRPEGPTCGNLVPARSETTAVNIIPTRPAPRGAIGRVSLRHRPALLPCGQHKTRSRQRAR